MKTVRLAISTGEHVADVAIPPFKIGPEVIIWGMRTFVFHHLITDSSPEDSCTSEYREVFAYFVPPDIEPEEK
jgi:hypothetical protein